MTDCTQCGQPNDNGDSFVCRGCLVARNFPPAPAEGKRGTRMSDAAWAKDEKRKQYCGGCRNNIYNEPNNMGVTECWSLETAEVVLRKFVHVDQVPPWNQVAERTLSCHHRERYITVGRRVTR